MSRSTLRPSPRIRSAFRALVLVVGGMLGGMLGGMHGGAIAQSLELGVDASRTSALTARLEGIPRAGGEIALGVRAGIDPGLRLDVKWSSPLAGIGTVVLEGSAEARFGGDVVARGSVGARGVLGPIAARLRIARFGAAPERFDAARLPGDAPFARGGSAQLAVDGRLDRQWLLAGSGTLWWPSAPTTLGLVVDVDAQARARGLLGRERDGLIALETRWSEGAATLAVGAGLIEAPRRAPEVAGTVFLDLDLRDGRTMLRPGVEIDGSWRSGDDRISATLVARPASREGAPWAIDLAWQRPWRDGRLTLQATGRTGARDGSALAVTLNYALPIDGVTR